jgi:diguanylate cyclase (GGDEF)-like protein
VTLPESKLEILLLTGSADKQRTVLASLRRRGIANVVRTFRTADDLLDDLRDASSLAVEALILVDISGNNSEAANFFARFDADPTLSQTIVFALTDAEPDLSKLLRTSSGIKGFVMTQQVAEDLLGQAAVLPELSFTLHRLDPLSTRTDGLGGQRCTLPGPGAAPRVLVVTPDKCRFETARQTLTGGDFTVQVASTMRDGLIILAAQTWDCLLLDAADEEHDIRPLLNAIGELAPTERPGLVILADSPADPSAKTAAASYEWLYRAGTDATGLSRVVRSACEKARLHREIAQRDNQLRRLTFYDLLTGLPNRRLFFDRLGQTVRESTRAGKEFALLLMDLNLFKVANDTYGHEAGDKLLQAVATRLDALLRESDTLARLGGDEFAALLTITESLDGALVVAEKIHSAFQEPFKISDHDISLDITVGVVLFPAHGENPETLLRNAGVAMYEGKARGKSVSVHGATDAGRDYEATLVAQGLKAAVTNSELFAVYQPQIRLDDGVVVGAEALVRWQHPELGLLPPVRFVPAAERSEIIDTLTMHMLELAMAQCRSWHASGRDLCVSVNLPARLLDQGDFPAHIESCLRRFGLQSTSLCLEVTETSIMRSPEQAERTLQALSRLGVRLSIDDFGTGYSSLQYLRNFPIDEIKIDRLFVSGLATERRDALIVESVLSLGKALEVEVVAEGIEDQAVWSRLRDIGCQLGQGYHIGMPMKAAEFDAWFQQWEIQRAAAMQALHTAPVPSCVSE